MSDEVMKEIERLEDAGQSHGRAFPAQEKCGCFWCANVRELARIAREEHGRAETALLDLGIAQGKLEIEVDISRMVRDRAEKSEAREESFLRTIEHAKAENSRLREALADIAALRDSFMQRR